MGFHRQGQPSALNRAEVTAIVAEVVAEEVAFIERSADPFLIDHDCLNPAGHQAIADCRDIVCRYCGRIFWR
jgi:hypothetical protein